MSDYYEQEIGYLQDTIDELEGTVKELKAEAVKDRELLVEAEFTLAANGCRQIAMAIANRLKEK